MNEAEIYTVICIAFCGVVIGFILGLKAAWADAKELYWPYIFGDKK
tara:strand:+ start:11402 stop:11539 length:138 start_codon:yes stop_codon:yes gene_type:complete